MDIAWDIVGSAAGGATICAALARAYVSHLISQLESVISELQTVQTELVKVTVKLEHLEEVFALVPTHDRKIAALEQAVIYADNNKSQPRKFPNGN